MRVNPKTLEKLRDLINEETEYRSGPQLVQFFNDLGFNDSYGRGFPSRWKYTDEKLSSINGTPNLDKCIKKIFEPINYIERIDELDVLINDFNQYLAFDKWQILRDNEEILLIKKDRIEIRNHTNQASVNGERLLKNNFKDINVEAIGLDSRVSDILKQRLIEIGKCIESKSPLAVVFLCGSTLEGILFGLAKKYPETFNKAKSAPKNKDGKVKKLNEWTLNSLINIACEVGLIKEDVKKHSHTLKDFRNYIHPYQQFNSEFNPDQHTAELSYTVLKTAIHQIEDFKNE